MNKETLKTKTQKQLLKMLENRENKIELLNEKAVIRSKERGSSAGSMNKTLNSIKHSKDLIKEEIEIIKEFIN